MKLFNENSFDKFLKDGLSNLPEHKPSSSDWDKMRGALINKKIFLFNRSYKSKTVKLFFYSISIICTVAVLIYLNTAEKISTIIKLDGVEISSEKSVLPNVRNSSTNEPLRKDITYNQKQEDKRIYTENESSIISSTINKSNKENSAIENRIYNNRNTTEPVMNKEYFEYTKETTFTNKKTQQMAQKTDKLTNKHNYTNNTKTIQNKISYNANKLKSSYLNKSSRENQENYTQKTNNSYSADNALYAFAKREFSQINFLLADSSILSDSIIPIFPLEIPPHQKKHKCEFSIGVVLGGGNTFLTNKLQAPRVIESKQSNIPYYNMGLIINSDIGSRLSISSGILLQQLNPLKEKIVKTEIDRTTYFSTSTMDITYFEQKMNISKNILIIYIPVNLKFNYYTNKKYSFFIGAFSLIDIGGTNNRPKDPTLEEFLISPNQTMVDNWVTTSSQDWESRTYQANLPLLGINTGLKHQLKNKKIHLGYELTYFINGFNNYRFSISESYTSSDASLNSVNKFSSLGLNVSLLYKLGK
ncbi:MAG: hypothetical protein J0M08_11565 [Bacteroidetes bacterium]|nr:hypothetical protein [Bacteroidota bacterium]